MTGMAFRLSASPLWCRPSRCWPCWAGFNRLVRAGTSHGLLGARGESRWAGFDRLGRAGLDAVRVQPGWAISVIVSRTRRGGRTHSEGRTRCRKKRLRPRAGRSRRIRRRGGLAGRPRTVHWSGLGRGTLEDARQPSPAQ